MLSTLTGKGHCCSREAVANTPGVIGVQQELCRTDSCFGGVHDVYEYANFFNTRFRRIFIAPSRIDRHTHHTTYRTFVGIGGLPAGEPAPPNTDNMLAVELMDPRRSWELPRPSIDSPALESSRVRIKSPKKNTIKIKIRSCSVPSTKFIRTFEVWLAYVHGSRFNALVGVFTYVAKLLCP